MDLLLDGDQFVFEPHPDEAPAFELPPVPGDGYAVEARAETMNMVTLGNSVRRGELDLVQIGAADVTDSVAGTETATIEGMLREHTGGNLAYKSSRMETTVDGRMSVTTRLEDGIILGGTMTDIWNGGTFILAAMSDDLCIGAGARATAPVDLWLNYLTGLEERPGTANADGIFVEAYGTLFEREYGPSVHAAGIAVLNGTTYQTLKTGFRPLMHVAMGVRNLIPAAGGPTAEPAPPSPPATPVAAGGMAAGGIVMAGAGAARASVNVALSADSMLDMFRAGDAAVDIENAADLRHAADTAAQVEDLRAAAANPQFADEAGQLDPTYASPHMEDLPGHPLADDPTYADPTYASPHMEDLPGHPLVDDVNQVDLIYETPIIDDFSGQPPPLPDGHPSMLPGGQPPPLPGGRPLPVDLVQQKVDSERKWLLLLFQSGDTWQEGGTRVGYLDMYKQAAALAETDPQRADLLREVGSRLQMAHVVVQNGKDPSMILGGAAAHLEELGHVDEAAALRRAMGDYDEFIAKMRVLGSGDLPPGVLDQVPTVDVMAMAEENPYHVLESDYDTVGGSGTGVNAGYTPPGLQGPGSSSSGPPPLPPRGQAAVAGHPLADDANQLDLIYSTPLGDDLSGHPPPLPDGHPSMLPGGQPPPLPGGRPLPVDLVQQKVDSERKWLLLLLQSGDTWEKGGTRVGYLDMYKQADALAETDPQRAELLREVGSRLQMAHVAVQNGKDPSMILGGAAAHLEELGHVDEAAALRRAMGDYDEFIAKMRVLGGGDLPPGVLDEGVIVDDVVAMAEENPYHVLESDYDTVGGLDSGMTSTSWTPANAPPAYRPPPPPPSGLEEPGGSLYAVFEIPALATDPRKPAFLGDLPALTPLRPWPPPPSLADAPPPAFLDAPPSSLPGGQGALDPQAGGHGSGAAADIADAARRQGDPLPQQPVQLEIPALQRLDAEGDDARRMLDVEPEQVADAGEDATAAARLDVDPGTGTEGGRAGTAAEAAKPTGRVPFKGMDRWKLAWLDMVGGMEIFDFRGPSEIPGRWRLDSDAGADAVLGDYADVVHHADSAVDGISDGQGAVHAAPPDTQAVADAMPDTSRITDGDYQTLADSNRKLTEGNALMDQLDSEYLGHRRDSNWRATLAYGDALYELRDDVFDVLAEFSMYTDAASGPKPNAKTAYLMLVKAADRAAAAEDVAAMQRIGEFLDGFNQRMQDTITDLGSRADEFEGVKTGSAFPLDPHIDQQKLAQWLDERMQDAARQMMEAATAGDTEAQKAWSNEMTYFQQVSLALEQGRNPLIESGDQGVYLRETGRTEQAEVYLKLHDSLMETMSDPSFHKSAAEMGDTTYAPVLTRPELGAAPALDDTAVPAAVDNVDTDVLRAEVQEPGGASQGDDGAQMDAGDYAANRDTINDQAGQGDYVHAPQDQPSGLRDEDYDPVFDPLIDSAEANAARIQPGVVQAYMDDFARFQGDTFERQFMADNPDGEHIDEHMTLTSVFTERRKVTDRARVDAANQKWGEMRVVDRRPLTEWNYVPPGMRSWKSPKQRAKAGKVGQVRGCEADYLCGRLRPGHEPCGRAGTDTECAAARIAPWLEALAAHPSAGLRSHCVGSRRVSVQRAREDSEHTHAGEAFPGGD